MFLSSKIGICTDVWFSNQTHFKTQLLQVFCNDASYNEVPRFGIENKEVYFMISRPKYFDRNAEQTVLTLIRPRGYKTFFVLNSVEHEILNAHKYKNIKKFSFY